MELTSGGRSPGNPKGTGASRRATPRERAAIDGPPEDESSYLTPRQVITSATVALHLIFILLGSWLVLTDRGVVPRLVGLAVILAGYATAFVSRR